MADRTYRYVECPFCRTGGLTVRRDEKESVRPMCGEHFVTDERGITHLKGTEYGPAGKSLLTPLLLLSLPLVLVACLVAL